MSDEHRVRRYLTAGSELHTQNGRQVRQERAENLIQLFAERYGAVFQAVGNARQ